MEKLEIALEKTSVEGKETGKEFKPLYETGYKGLRLINEKIHAGGTSIKYWM
jgi:hypothetical protein